MKALAVLPLAACASFEDPTIVIDMRVVGMTMMPAPERVIDIDFRDQPPTIDDVLAELQRQPLPRVCAAIADPGRTRDLRYSMRACLLDDDSRCDPVRPQLLLADGERLLDPETSAGEPACAVVPADAAFVGLLQDSLMERPESAIVGVDYAVELRVGSVDAHPSEDLFATKRGRVAARIPETREPNHNPAITELQLTSENGGLFVERRSTSCATPFEGMPQARSGARMTLYPVEAEGARETFQSPTLDGDFLEVTEYIEYQWLATDGAFSDELTGGPPDLLGNQSLLGTDWRAPVVTRPLDVAIWMLARDDRYGVTILQTCIRVLP